MVAYGGSSHVAWSESNVRKSGVRNFKYHKCGKNRIIDVETKMYVGKLYVRRRGRYEFERCDVELSRWFILL